jgi:protein arginine kinase
MSELEKNLQPDVVISSRVRLARNYKDVPFSSVMNHDWAEKTIDYAAQAVIAAGQDQNFQMLRMEGLSADERNRLVEHHLISYDLLKFSGLSAALISKDKTLSIMVNEEDHLRIQGLLPGMQLIRAAEIAFDADSMLSGNHEYAFDAQWGYLTSCPTNTGTGMRASTMLHLPALSATRQMGAVMQAVSRLGLTVRGLYGEGSDALGNLYQLSNQVTLGKTEEDMIRSLIAATRQLADHELAVREKLIERNPVEREDKIMRSVGIMSQARVMPLSEFMQYMSDMRLAVCSGYMQAELQAIDQMTMDLQPASIRVRCGSELTDAECDQVRAELLRDQIGRMLDNEK